MAAYYLKLRNGGDEAHGFGRFYSVKMSGGPMKGERQRCRVAPVGSTAGAQWSAADQSRYRKKAKKQIA